MKSIFASFIPLLFAAAAVARSESLCSGKAPLAKCCRNWNTYYQVGCVSPAPDVTRQEFMDYCRESHAGRWAYCCEPPQNERLPDETLVCDLFRGDPEEDLGFRVQEGS
ncbi:hypothetical protein R3P38DRAFT_3233594 [Favolaschia claudopus]|uniref:Uncharacterized protein n=1 Tax=Favolaschia claudopus TaxID=2862362 RepID=A0AAV9ZI37_9AGAR